MVPLPTAKYDRDLRFIRRVALALSLVNLAGAVFESYERHWAPTASGIIWALCCWAWRRMAESQQQTRDLARQIHNIIETIKESRQP
jgi:hypothetical protein